MATNYKKKTVSFFNSHMITVVSISMVLFLLGLILLIGFLGNGLSRYVKENIAVSVILSEDLPDAKIRKLRDELEKQPFVKSTEYISKEQALLEMERELGGNPETFLGFNPFRASIEVRLMSEYTHPDSLALIEKRIAGQTSVTDVQYSENLMQKVNQNIRKISYVLLILMAVLIIISFVLINNTVKLLIYSKRFLIYTMRLVGATPGFIRRPFMTYNLICGVIAGCLAIIMLIFSLLYLKKEFGNIDEVLGQNVLLATCLTVMLAGITISVTAAYFAVNRYLNMARGKLYYI
jgi:cell division transport system permease protein